MGDRNTIPKTQIDCNITHTFVKQTDKNRGTNSIMIEINRKLYLHNNANIKSDNHCAIKTTIQDFIKMIEQNINNTDLTYQHTEKTKTISVKICEICAISVPSKKNTDDID